LSASILWVTLALAVLLATGIAAQTWLLPRTETYWYEYWALAFLLGTATVSVLWVLLSPFYHLMHPMPLLSIAAVLLFGATQHRLRVRLPAGVSPMLWIDVLLVVALCVELAAVVAASLHTTLGWDGIFNFELKARLIYENDPPGRLPLPYLSDSSRAWSHPEYPLMIPFAEFWLYSWLGRVDQSAIKVLFPLFYVSVVALLAGAVRRFSSPRTALMTAVALGALPPLTHLPGAASGYADVPLAAALVGLVSFACIGMATNDVHALRLAGVLGAIAAWTKIEGLMLAGSVGVIASVIGVAQGRRHATMVLAIPMVLMVPWLVVQTLYGIGPADFTVAWQGLGSNVRSLPEITRVMVAELLRPGHWGLLWPCWLIAVGLQFRADSRTKVWEWLPVAGVTLPLALYVLVFVFSTWPDVTEHVRLAMPRLLVPLAPVALMSTVLRLHAAYHHA
jgi:hypothetical protein